MTQKLPTVDYLNSITYRNTALHPDQFEWRINEICDDMKHAARHGIRCVRIPPDEPFIAEITALFEKDQYTVKREYIRTSYKSVPIGDEFVGWIITW